MVSRVLRVIITTMGMVLSLGCTTFSSEESGSGTSSNNASAPGFYTPGNTLMLEASGGDVAATVIDLDGDGIGDGLDLDGNGIPEFVYLTKNAATTMAVDTTVDGEVDFYIILYNGNLYITGSGNIDDTSVTLFSDSSGTPTGLDTDGDGEPDGQEYSPVGDETEPYLNIDQPGDAGNITETLRLDVSCQDDESYCHHIIYTITDDGGTEDGPYYIYQNETTIVFMQTAGSYTLDITGVDAAGNKVAESYSYTRPNPSLNINMSGGTTTDDAGTDFSFEVSLNSAPTSDVTVPLSLSTNFHSNLSHTSLTFTTENWGEGQSVTVYGKADTMVNIGDSTLDENYDITVGPMSSDDEQFDNTGEQTVNATHMNTEADPASNVIWYWPIASEILMTENGSTFEFYINLVDVIPQDPVSVNLASANLTRFTTVFLL